METDFDFDAKPRALARESDPGTSAAAAASISTEVLGRLHREILAALCGSEKGLTTIELAAAIGCGRDSISPRMKWLVVRGAVHPTGEHRRSGGSCRSAIVWSAKLRDSAGAA